MPVINPKESKLWIWRPALLIGVIIFIVGINWYMSVDTDDKLIFLMYGNKPISKVEMNIRSNDNEKNILLTDRNLLDSLSIALSELRVVRATPSHSFDTVVNIEVLRGTKTLNFEMTTSVYTGWLVWVGNESLNSPYLVDLVRRLAEQ